MRELSKAENGVRREENGKMRELSKAGNGVRREENG